MQFAPILYLASRVALFLSGWFCIAVLIVLIFVPSRIFDPDILLYAVAGVALGSRLIIDKFKKFEQAFLLFGSFSFFFLFIASLLENNFAAQVYAHYSGLEIWLNNLLVALVIYFFALGIIGWALYGAFTLVKKTAKGTAYEPLAKASAIIFILLFVLVIYIDEFLPGFNPYKHVVDLSKYLLPFLGFSLAYVHARFLISSLAGKINQV